MDGGRVVLAYGVNDCEAKLGEMEQGLAAATQKLAAVEAREKVYTDSIEAQQKEIEALKRKLGGKGG